MHRVYELTESLAAAAHAAHYPICLSKPLPLPLLVTEASSDYRSAGKIVELPIPKASAGHVLVKNTAACVAAYDVLVLENRFVQQQEFPFTRSWCIIQSRGALLQ